MGLGHSPRIVTDGLVLALDAGNPKNYNAGISTNWTDKVGGNNGTLVGGTHHNDGPFVGAGSVYFDGDGDRLTISSNSAFDISSGAYTVELYVNFIASPSVVVLFGLAGTSTSGNAHLLYSGGVLYWQTRGTSSNQTSYSWSPSLSRWYHLAVSWNGSNSLKLFIDGVEVASNTVSPTINQNGVNIGGASDGYSINGYISNLRLIKGTALYTSNFTPPTKSLTAITNTVLLTCQGNTIADASSSAHTITANGDISLTKEPFAGAGAVQFDGSDYLEIPASSDFSFTTAPWTFECWVYHKDWTTGADGQGFQYLIYPQQPSHPTYPVAIAVHQGRYIIVDSANYGSPWSSSYNNIGSYGTAASLNTWNHVAYTRDSSGVDRVFVNGTLQFSATGKTVTSPSISSVARFGGTGSAYINGYISNLRLIKGTALYTSNFTPPAEPLTAVTNTKLLTCQGQNIKDASSNAHAITVNGDAKATIVSSSFEFDGSNDYVDCGTSLDYGFGTGDLTVEAWFYANGTQGSNACFLSLKDGSGGDDWQFLAANDKIKVRNIDLVTDEIDYTPNEWHHAAWTRQGSSNYLFLDGIQAGPVSDSTDYDYGLLKVGVNRTSTSFFDGYVSNVRVYKGKALSTAEIQQNYNATKGRYA